MSDRLVLVDGDDTLWHSQALFDSAYRDTSRLLSDEGFDVTGWADLVTAIDLHNVAVMGFTPDRFIRSCEQAYEAIAQAQAAGVDHTLLRRVGEIAAGVFRTQPRNVDGVEVVLTHLQTVGKLVLYTKGDDRLQHSRIAGSGLDAYFDDVIVVRDKTVDVLAGTISRLAADAAESSSIGDSFRSDIDPALQNGLHAVWVKRDTWAYESDCTAYGHEMLDIVTDLTEVPELMTTSGSTPRRRHC